MLRSFNSMGKGTKGCVAKSLIIFILFNLIVNIIFDIFLEPPDRKDNDTNQMLIYILCTGGIFLILLAIMILLFLKYKNRKIKIKNLEYKLLQKD